MHSGSVLQRALTLAVVAVGSFHFFVHVVDAANRLTPESVSIRAFASRSDRLDLLIRVPLAAVKDVQFPTTGRDGHLDMEPLQSMLPGAARHWIAPTLEVFAAGRLVAPRVEATRIAIAADQSFDSYEQALASFAAVEIGAEEAVFWESVWFDIHFSYPLTANSGLAIRPRVADLGVKVSTDLTFVDHRTPIRSFSFEGDPGLIHLAPSLADATTQFVSRGARFVLGSTDLLLLLLCLALPFRRYREFGPSAATFVAGFLIALTAHLSGLTPETVWFPPLVTALGATVILLVALANVAARVTPRRRALLSLAAGGIFGLVAAAQLATLAQFGGAHPIAAAAAFAAGAATSIAALLAVFIPVLSMIFSFARAERIERIIVSALAADTAWMWLSDRWTLVRRVPWQAAFGDLALAAILKGLAIATLGGGVVWLINEWLKTKGYADVDVESAAREHAR